MGINDIVNLIVNNSVAIFVIAYFIFKDYKFNEKLINLTNKVNDLIELIERKISND